ncbi:MAG: HlyD family secretion protein [gamma proteobacterium symbiont of Bathyaustriella thionipta]|nr:HlyD family secretion protein [gamma proteobacterium symbiont of Bathyaustriella thionipta]MCU7951180.1 HlyD family secretion protein [gamma proteobacterium symbiont of Bathyaustriella thionipta]MCU7954228.1 HlyD family secretion protein [gamma proteobacterium symbiont of Bathyaustriella thionipta]MCU7957703.1 HlyD family secretion protein [gamma proteobacterium symbiont of Bathyaustriella thionipta]MCU7968680.1 HlyD family secretion protein [gamma proteobacterium symbiont of Bathyaustriella
MSNEEQEQKPKLTEPVEDTLEESTAKQSVKKGFLLFLIMILLSLTWYLAADRYTPYTQQARIDGYVVGVSSEVSGVVNQVWVKNNQTIEEGQPLFEINRSQYEIALNKARSQLEDVKRQIAAGTAGVESAQSNLLAKQANKKKAEQDVIRLEGLYKKDPGAISVRRLESSQASYAQALAKVSGAEAEVVRAVEQKGGEGENNTKLKSAISAVDKAELDLKHTTTYASSRGIVTDLRTDVGQFANAGSPVMTFISMHDIWINAEFTENNLGHMKIGSPVELVIDSIPAQVFSGEVRSIGLGVAVTQDPPAGTLPTIENNRDWLRQSQRFPVIIAFDVNQSESLREFIRIGGQAEVIAFTEGQDFLNGLAKLYIRVMSWFSYAY